MKREFAQRLKEKREYLPNKKYFPEMFIFFDSEYRRLKSQKEAFDSLAKKFKLNPINGDNFLRQYRRRKK